MLMWISLVVSGALMVVLAFLYFKTVRSIEQDEANEAMALAQRQKNKRIAHRLAVT